MNKPVQPNTLLAVPPATENPLDRAVRLAAENLRGITMVRLWSVACPQVEEAEALVDNLFVIAKVVDDMLEVIGKAAKAHFGHTIELDLFRDQFRNAIEGNATHTIMVAAEAASEADREHIEANRADLWRDYSDEAA